MVMDDFSKSAYYDIRKKSVFVAYLLRLLGLGLNHFYAGNMVQGILQLILTPLVVLLGLAYLLNADAQALPANALGQQLLLVVMVAGGLWLLWLLLDIIMIPSYIGGHNRRVLQALGLRYPPELW